MIKLNKFPIGYQFKSKSYPNSICTIVYYYENRHSYKIAINKENKNYKEAWLDHEQVSYQEPVNDVWNLLFSPKGRANA